MWKKEFVIIVDQITECDTHTHTHTLTQRETHTHTLTKNVSFVMGRLQVSEKEFVMIMDQIT